MGAQTLPTLLNPMSLDMKKKAKFFLLKQYVLFTGNQTESDCMQLSERPLL